MAQSAAIYAGMEVVSVRRLSGEQLRLEGPTTGSTCWDVKGWIKSSAGIPKHSQHLFVNGTRALANDMIYGHMDIVLIVSNAVCADGTPGSVPDNVLVADFAALQANIVLSSRLFS